MRKVVHIHKVTRMAGSESHLLALLPRLDRNRFQVELLVLSEPGRVPEEYLTQFVQAGIPAEPVLIRRDVDPICVLTLRERIARARPDLVHTHLIHADLYGGLAARLAGVPRVVSTKHNDDAFRQNWLLKVPIRAANRHCDRVITISWHLADFVARVEDVPLQRITAIHYGLEATDGSPATRSRARETLGVGDGTPLVVSVGRLTEQKGHRYLLDAWRWVCERTAEGTLVVVGAGPLREALGTSARRLGIEDRVVWTGWRTDVAQILTAADLYVHPSLWEGFGLVLLEAMSAQKCVIASRVSAVPEIVVHGETGWLVPSRDGEALGEVILRMLKDAAARRCMGEAGRRRVLEHFGVERMVRATEAVYDALLG